MSCHSETGRRPGRYTPDPLMNRGKTERPQHFHGPGSFPGAGKQTRTRSPAAFSAAAKFKGVQRRRNPRTSEGIVNPPTRASPKLIDCQ